MSTPPTNMSEPFKREERYIVIKRKHLQSITEASLRAALEQLGVSPVECVVVESDWPEYETVWKMIEARCTGTPTNTEAEGLAERMRYFIECIAHADREGWNDATIDEARRIITLTALSSPSEVSDWWKPEPGDPFWMLEASDGEWLKNEHSLLGTRDAAKAMRFPTRQAAYDHPARMNAGSKWWDAKPTEHTWITPLSSPSEVEVERVEDAMAPTIFREFDGETEDRAQRWREVGSAKDKAVINGIARAAITAMKGAES